MPFGFSISRTPRLDIDVSGGREFSRAMLGLDLRASNMKPVFHEAIDWLREVVRQTYMSKGARAGNPWDELTDRYLARKIRQGLDPRLMLATHDLYNSLAHHSPDSIDTVTDDGFDFGSKRKSKDGKSVLAFHQSRAPRTKMPRRAPVDLLEADRDVIVEMFRAHIIGLRRALL